MANTNNEWLHMYQNNLTGPPQPGAVRWTGEVTDATTVTTTATSSVSSQLGRVARPIIRDAGPERRGGLQPPYLIPTPLIFVPWCSSLLVETFVVVVVVVLVNIWRLRLRLRHASL
ncbi:hypothetical protein HanRHA438_Chr03g0146901 [Helianthus annuus]|nr:hypothetical protein HanRHA438_Chr03g0146901 [Helianthus annuus]